MNREVSEVESVIFEQNYRCFMHLYSVPVFQAEAPGPLCQWSTRLKEGACVCLYM